MEFFTKSSTVILRSHTEKHLSASSDHLTIHQSRHPTRYAFWRVEPVQNNPTLIRLKNHQTQKYLTASTTPFLLGGMSGKRVIQSFPHSSSPSTHWKPVRDGFQIKLCSADGTFLRANSGSSPWRNSVTHDNKGGSICGGMMKGWLLWDVVKVEIGEEEEVREYLSSFSSFGSSLLDDDDDDRSESCSPMSLISYESPKPSVCFRQSGMDLFRNAAVVRLRSHHDKYLTAEEDEESVTQKDKSGSSKNAKWVVEFVSTIENVIRLKSNHNKYLTASNQPFLLGMTGRKVLQTLPKRLDSSVEWEPIKQGNHIKLKTRYGNFLRANGGLPPWRNSVTHDIPHRSVTQDWVIWDVEVLEIQVHFPKANPLRKAAITEAMVQNVMCNNDSSRSESFVSSVSSCGDEVSECEGRVETKLEGRTVYYHIASDDYKDGRDESLGEGFALIFGGSSVEDLKRRLEEMTGLDDIVVCTRSPLNHKLYPLRLQLPPNINMHVVVVPRYSKVARDLAKSGAIM